MATPNTLLYLCYGSPAIYDQTIYSILSAIRAMRRSGDRSRIVVYSDQPSLFKTLPVDVYLLEKSILDSWLGQSDYIHRRKTCLIIEVLKRFGGKVAFIDSDTYFTASPQRIFKRIGPGSVCFHICEGYLAFTRTPFDSALLKQLSERDYFLPSGELVSFSPKIKMWNTGVVGVDSHDIDKMHEALALSDEIWANADPNGPYGKKIHHAEQFATGYAFRNCFLNESYDTVYHYWPSHAKATFGMALANLVQSGLVDQSDANLQKIFAKRYRERGLAAARDRTKMQVRTVALRLAMPVAGVRRSV